MKNMSRQLKYYYAHRKQVLAHQKRYVEKNRAKIRAFSRTYYELNRSKIQKQRRQWAHNHQEQVSTYLKKWNDAHPQRYNGNATRTPEQWKAQGYVQRHQELLGSECELCPEDNKQTKNLTAHHLDYDFPEIIVTCCRRCHSFVHRGVD
jgi:hypothetical protein